MQRTNFLLSLLLLLCFLPAQQVFAQDRGVARQIEPQFEVSEEYFRLQLNEAQQSGDVFYSPQQIANKLKADPSQFRQIEVRFLNGYYTYAPQNVAGVLVPVVLSKLLDDSDDVLVQLERYYLAVQLTPGMYDSRPGLADLRFKLINIGLGTRGLDDFQDLETRAVDAERLMLLEQVSEENKYVGGTFLANRLIGVMKAHLRGK